MASIPRDPALDSSLAFLAEPYEFISKRCRRFGADLFETRLLLQRTICMTGPGAAELFSDPDKFTRQRAAPRRVVKTLFGEGGVQGLDGETHRHRKAMFMALMTPARIAELASLTEALWAERGEAWEKRPHVVLYDEAREVLTRAVCAWSAVPLSEEDVAARTAQLSAMFHDAGSLGPAHWRARAARLRAERWIEKLILDVRNGSLKPAAESAARVVALHRDEQGRHLDPRVAAVELINVLRPTVAVSVFVVFAAHALHLHPECRAKLLADPGYLELFIQEVRRYYPFFPAGTARVAHDFEWNGYRFAAGKRVLLDLYGTNRDPRTWSEPERFRPERFAAWDGSAFSFIPQGAGDHHLNHRCPGEWITIALMKAAVLFLARGVRYELPEQDLALQMSRMPALPGSRFVMTRVRRAS